MEWKLGVSQTRLPPGALPAQEAALGTIPCNDNYIKLTFLRSRWYSLANGRFTTRDVWRDYNRPSTLNGWSYAAGDPINRIDPTGLDSCGPTCQIMRYQLKPFIVSASQRFNLSVFTNMTDNGFAAMLGAKLLFESGVRPGDGFTEQEYYLEQAQEYAGALDYRYELFWRAKDQEAGVPEEIAGISYGRANVYIKQSTNAQDWWSELGNHLDVYGTSSDRYSAYNTSYLKLRNYNGFPYMDETPPDSLEGGEMLDDKIGLERQALVMAHAGFLNYEGVAGTPAQPVLGDQQRSFNRPN
jgi:RHS repeat-associated protein